MTRRAQTLRVIGFALALATMSALPASAQTVADAVVQVRRVPSRPGQHLGVRAFVAVDSDSMAAASTFNAVLGTSALSARGGGVDLLNVWRGLFIRVAATSVSKTGSRVVVVDKQAVSLGIPLTIEMRPVEFGAGWRSSIGPRQRGAWYVGGGLVHLVYRETSKFASVGDDTDMTVDGAVIFGGVDIKLWRFIVAGGEVQFRSIPNALGGGGASQAFNETNLGGATARGLIGVRF